MYHKLGLILSILLIAPFGMGTLGKVYITEAEPGDYAQVIVNVNNFERNYKYADMHRQYQGKRVHDQRITLWIPELNIYQRYTSYDLYGDDRDSKHMNIEIPAKAKPGSYLTRIMVSNDHFKETSYTWLSVV